MRKNMDVIVRQDAELQNDGTVVVWLTVGATDITMQMSVDAAFKVGTSLLNAIAQGVEDNNPVTTDYEFCGECQSVIERDPLEKGRREFDEKTAL